jgi:hypothetical protein
LFHSSSALPGFSCTEVGTCDDAFLDDFDHRPVWVGVIAWPVLTTVTTGQAI